MLSERTHTHGMPWLYDLIRISEVAECPLLCLNLCSLNLCHFWNAILGLKTTGFVKWASCVVILKKCCICQNIKHLPSQQNYISKHPTLVETTKYCTDSPCKINLHKRWSKNNSNKTFEESPSQNLHTYTLTMNACKQKRSTFCFETPGAKFNQCLHYPTLWIQNLCPKSRQCTHHYSTHLFTSFAASCNHFFLPARWSCTSKLPGGTVATQTSNIKRPGDCPLCWDGFAGQRMLLTSSPDSSDAIGAIRTTTLQHQRAAIPGWLFQELVFLLSFKRVHPWRQSTT